MTSLLQKLLSARGRGNMDSCRHGWSSAARGRRGAMASQVPSSVQIQPLNHRFQTTVTEHKAGFIRAPLRTLPAPHVLSH